MHRAGQCFSPKTAFKPNPPSFWPEEKKAEAASLSDLFLFCIAADYSFRTILRFHGPRAVSCLRSVPPRVTNRKRAPVLASFFLFFFSFSFFFITTVWLSFRFLALCIPRVDASSVFNFGAGLNYACTRGWSFHWTFVYQGRKRQLNEWKASI